jgi:hypothetical protein
VWNQIIPWWIHLVNSHSALSIFLTSLSGALVKKNKKNKKNWQALCQISCQKKNTLLEHSNWFSSDSELSIISLFNLFKVVMHITFDFFYQQVHSLHSDYILTTENWNWLKLLSILCLKLSDLAELCQCRPSLISTRLPWTVINRELVAKFGNAIFDLEMLLIIDVIIILSSVIIRKFETLYEITQIVSKNLNKNKKQNTKIKFKLLLNHF